MRRLFFKIFAWFWLAQVLIGLVMYQVVTRLNNSTETERVRENERPRGSANIELQAHALGLIYEHGGARELSKQLQKLSADRRSNWAVLTADGRRLAGADVAPLASSLAITAVSNNSPQWQNEENMTIAAQPLFLSNGRPLVLVAQWARPPRPRGRGGGPASWLFFWRDVQNPSGAGVLRLLALLASSGLVCYGLAFYFTSPAEKLRRATQQLASGNLSARVAPQMGRRRDELADLGRDFDQMATRIESLMLSERRLLADISHELRSPLARLTVALDLAETGANDSTQKYLDRIRREAERINEMIGQLLSLSRWESGHTQMQLVPVQLSQLLHDVAHDADFEAQSRGRHVQVLGSQHCSVAGDESLLRSALENVVRNAVLYTVENTTIELRLQTELRNGRQWAVITVRDYGPGVAEEALSELFRPFYRVAEARDRQSGGTGLGLAITERAVRVHGGHVRAANTEQGLIVTIELPLLENGNNESNQTQTPHNGSLES